MNLRSKLSLGEWNIGLVPVHAGSIDFSSVRWIKHRYRNSCFADPFIYRVGENTIELFVEQIFFWHKNARLAKLTVDRQSGLLLQCTPILQLDTHLSYPFIIRRNGKIYVMPENVASGRLDLYEYDERSEKLRYLHPVIHMPLADATIVEWNNSYYLFATKKGTDNSDLYIWVSEEIFTGYRPICGKPVKSDLTGSRMAGAFWRHKGRLFRPAQDCNGGFGKGILVYEITDLSVHGYKEQLIECFYPSDPYYNAGIHTLNYHQDIGVIDGYRVRVNPLMKLARKINR